MKKTILLLFTIFSINYAYGCNNPINHSNVERMAEKYKFESVANVIFLDLVDWLKLNGMEKTRLVNDLAYFEWNHEGKNIIKIADRKTGKTLASAEIKQNTIDVEVY